MTRSELHQALSEVLYIEDYGMVDVVLASTVANALRLGDPVWLTIIGPSSGGKSQFIRPLAISNPQFIYRIDDLTANTFLSGALKYDETLLGRIGAHGMLSMDDLTVLFSKNNEARAEILSQFRMIYDGRFSKATGTNKGTHVWPPEGSGHIGMIAGSTPSIYKYFNEVADMGERFISYRMKDIDVEKATDFVLESNLASSELNERVAAIFTDYFTTIMPQLSAMATNEENLLSSISLPDDIQDTIRSIAPTVTLLRTPVMIDEWHDGVVTDIPVPELPFRVMKQLTTLAKAMLVMHQLDEPGANTLPANLVGALEWTAYSLANDKRRNFMRVITRLHDDGVAIDRTALAIGTGLDPMVINQNLSQLQALRVIERKADNEWRVKNEKVAAVTRRLDPLQESIRAERGVYYTFMESDNQTI